MNHPLYILFFVIKKSLFLLFASVAKRSTFYRSFSTIFPLSRLSHENSNFCLNISFLFRLEKKNVDSHYAFIAHQIKGTINIITEFAQKWYNYSFIKAFFPPKSIIQLTWPAAFLKCQNRRKRPPFSAAQKFLCCLCAEFDRSSLLSFGEYTQFFSSQNIK